MRRTQGRQTAHAANRQGRGLRYSTGDLAGQKGTRRTCLGPLRQCPAFFPRLAVNVRQWLHGWPDNLAHGRGLGGRDANSGGLQGGPARFAGFQTTAQGFQAGLQAGPGLFLKTKGNA